MVLLFNKWTKQRVTMLFSSWARWPLFFIAKYWCTNFIPFILDEWKKNHRRQKNIWLKAYTKPVIWWWKLWPGKQRVEERFESTSQNYVIFFTNYILNSSLRSRLYTCQFFLIFTLKTIIASSYRKMCRETRRVKMHE